MSNFFVQQSDTFVLGDGYYGFSFSEAGSTAYGWLLLGFQYAGGGYSSIVQGYAYNTSGAAVQAGFGAPAPVPEPAGLALMALGAAVLAAARHCRQSVGRKYGSAVGARAALHEQI